MISIGINTQARKFQFFDEIRESYTEKNLNSINIINEQKEEKKEDKKENKKEDKKEDKKEEQKEEEKKEEQKEKEPEIILEKLNINLSSVYPQKEGGMKVVDGVLFICGKIIDKKTKKRTDKILKVIDNEVIDEYTMFNTYYDYLLMKYGDKTLLIVLGSTKYGEKFHQVTSLKFYDASHFIEKKDERYPIKTKISDVEENYPELLLKEIKFYKKGNNIICESEGNLLDGINHLGNCLSFTVDPTLNYAAISLPKGEILIINALPSLLDFNKKKLKTVYLYIPEKGDSVMEITNIKFGQIYSGKGEKKILYVSTKKYLAYYEWNFDEKGSDDLDNNIQCKFIKNVPGVEESCLYAKNNGLLIASNDNKFIYEYSNLKLNELEKDSNGNIKAEEKGKKNGELAFEGNKRNITYFNGYIVYQILGKTFSTLQIYDNINNFFVFIKSYAKKIISICSDNEYIYIFVEENESKKYIVKLVEKENKKKFETFFARKFYDTATDYAKYLGYDDYKLTEIYKKQAEFEYSRGEFNKSIQAYINTINFLDPSIIIQKFLTKSKMEYLIKYLEAIESNITFKQINDEKYSNYLNLLLNCYLMKEEIPKLEKFLEKKKDISKEILKTAIDVCLDTQNIDLALSIAKKKNMHEDYLQILILRLNLLEEALDYIYPENEKENEKKATSKENEAKILKEKVDLFCKFGENFLKTELSDIPNLFFQKIKRFLGQNNNLLEKEDKKRLLEIFVSNDQFYKDVFKLMINYGLELDKNNLHRRIELYLEDNEKNKIIEILKDKKYIGLYDNEYLIMLFKHKDFYEGIEVISELTNQNQELMSLYIQKRDYEKVINLCERYGNSEKSFWGIALNFFVDKTIRDSLDEEETKNINEHLQRFLDLILQKKAMLAVNILDIINEKNDEIPLDILRNFLDNSLEAEITPLEEKSVNLDVYSSQIKNVCNKIKEIQTQASSFKLSKCEVCFMGITFPAICFRCGHCYHTMCLSANDDNDLDNIDCPKCEEERERVKQQMVDSKAIYEDVDTIDKLNKEISGVQDKIEFIQSLYGRGLINIGPAYDDYISSEKNNALSLVRDPEEKKADEKDKENSK